MLQERAKVYAVGKSQENRDKLKSEIPSIYTIQVDVSDWDKTKTAVEQIGIVDLLVKNAGIHHLENFVDVDFNQFNNTINTNFKSAFNITQIVTRGLIAAGRPGAVVNMSSVGGIRSSARVIPYCVSKAMMDMLTKITALELGPHKFRVNSMNPTGIHTDMTNHLYENEEFQRMFISKHPIGKFCPSEDVVKATMFLLSNDSAMITGSCLAVDGGYVLH